MGIEVRHLQVWTAPEGLEDRPDPSVLPLPAEALYSYPNPNGGGKQCGNCVLYASVERTCFIHDPQLKISDNQVCGYHVSGEPAAQHGNRPPMDPVAPELSGLVTTEKGAYCGICEHYDSGTCFALQEDGAYASVEDMACCTRWAPRK